MINSRRARWGVLLLAGFFSTVAAARGPSPYLPLNLSPEIERQIDQVLLLAGKPIVKRPIAAATVLDALPAACDRDKVLCERVRRYLNAYTARFGVTHASIEGGVANDSDRTLPNRRGMSAGDEWAASATAHYQFSDYIFLQLGGVAYPDETAADGSMLSIGTSKLQLDIGYRDHSWSPMTDSAMLIGTQARTIPGVTLSNYTPITGLNLTYEAFLGWMSRTDDIAYQECTGSGQEVTCVDRTTSGNPRLGGLNLSVEPVPGWSLGASRLLQFAGGERRRSWSDFFNAFFLPTRYDNVSDSLSDNDQFGNQTAAFTSKFLFPTRRPFAVYFEYAGEDGSRSEGWRLGNVSLSAGIDIPRLWDRFDLTYEVSEWQNSWYTNGVYPHGMSNDGHVIGHWGADERSDLDGVGAQSHSLRIGWTPSFGGVMEARLRTLQNEDYGTVAYQRERDISLRYSRSWNDITYGGEVNVGSDVFGQDFRRYMAFVRYAPGGSDQFAGSFEPLPESAARQVDIFVDAGLGFNRVEYDPSDHVTPKTDNIATGPHIGIGARRSVSSRSDLGVRVEFDDIDGASAIGVRAIDYRYHLSRKLAVGGYAGAKRYDGPTPAYGYYGGLNAQIRDLMPRIDLTLDVHASDKIARDAVLETDPASTWGDVIYTVYGASLYLSYRF